MKKRYGNSNQKFKQYSLNHCDGIQINISARHKNKINTSCRKSYFQPFLDSTNMNTQQRQRGSSVFNRKINNNKSSSKSKISGPIIVTESFKEKPNAKIFHNQDIHSLDQTGSLLFKQEQEGVQQLHYQIVRMQQRSKHMIKG